MEEDHEEAPLIQSRTYSPHTEAIDFSLTPLLSGTRWSQIPN